MVEFIYKGLVYMDVKDEKEGYVKALTRSIFK